MSFADNLKRILETKRVSQSELSRRTGINRPMISEYVNGKYEPKTENLFKIAQALAVDLGELSEDYKIGNQLSAFAAGKGSIAGVTFNQENGIVNIVDKHTKDSTTTHSITNNGTMNGNIVNGDVNGGTITTTNNIHHGISDSHYAKVFEAIFKDYPEAYAVLDQVKVTDDGDLKNIDQCDEKYIKKMAKALLEALQEAHDNKKNSVEIEI